MSEKFVKTAVIGHPIGHSKSPMIHEYWISEYGLSGCYDAVDIAPEDLTSKVLSLIADGYSGFNVTVPHKISVMDLCDALDDSALAIGAVNTVSVEDGKIYGSNTDAYGFITNLDHNAPDGWSIEGRDALVIGAGGAANAVVYALLEAGAKSVTITNRTAEKAQMLANIFCPDRVRVCAWEEKDQACKGKALIVNTTSLGMSGQAALDLSLSGADAGTVVYDIVYAPLITPLLLQAKDKGLPIVTGIGMLLYQAQPGFERWRGVKPEVTEALERMVLA